MDLKMKYTTNNSGNEHRCPDITYQQTSFQNITQIKLYYDSKRKLHCVYLQKLRGYKSSGIVVNGRYAMMNAEAERIINILKDFKFNLLVDTQPFGFDGTSYQIEIGGITGCVFKWWMYCPPQWEMLATVGSIMSRCLTESRLLNAAELMNEKN